MKATEDLIDEHAAVLVALKILDKVAAAIEAGKGDAPGHLEQLLDFFKGFVDRCHHGKEEDVLFPELERLGVGREGGPIGVMLSDHKAGRSHVRALAENLERLRRGEGGATAGIAEHARAYHDMLQAHISRENNVLFPMADRIVSESAAARLAEEFDVIERDRVGEGRHEAYHAMLHELKDRYGVA
jgi:hemerythrin-like domain-containing protein